MSPAEQVKMFLAKKAQGLDADGLRNLRSSLSKIRATGKFPDGITNHAAYEQLSFQMKQLAGNAALAEAAKAGVKGQTLDDALKAIQPGWSAEKRAEYIAKNGEALATRLGMAAPETSFNAGEQAVKFFEDQQKALGEEKTATKEFNQQLGGGDANSGE